MKVMPLALALLLAACSDAPDGREPGSDVPGDVPVDVSPDAGQEVAEFDALDVARPDDVAEPEPDVAEPELPPVEVPEETAEDVAPEVAEDVVPDTEPEFPDTGPEVVDDVPVEDTAVDDVTEDVPQGPSEFTLTVDFAGTGGAAVSWGAIDATCTKQTGGTPWVGSPPPCTATFDAGTVVTLRVDQLLGTATGWVGWSEGCVPDLDDPATCHVTMDQDRTVIATTHQGAAWEHSASWGSAGVEEALKVAFDQEGHVLLTGSPTETFTLGGATLQAAGGADLVVARLSPTGELLWAHRLGDAFDQWGLAVAAHPSGDVLVAGSFRGELAFGADPLVATGQDLFVARLAAADGAEVWSHAFTTSTPGQGLDYAWVHALTTMEDGTVFAVGDYTGTLDITGEDLAADSTQRDAFAFALLADGQPLWATALHGPQVDFATAVSGGPDGLEMTGSFVHSLDLGGTTLTVDGGRAAYVARLEPTTGAVLDARTFGTDATHPEGLAVDAAGNLYVSGTFSEPLTFGGKTHTPTSADNDTLFILSIDPLGADRWLIRSSTSASTSATAFASNGLALGPSEDLFATGTYTFGGVLGATMFPKGGSSSKEMIWLARVRPDGTLFWARAFGAALSHDGATGLAAAPDGTLALTGYYEGSLDLGGPAPHTPEGASDWFLGLLGP